MVKALALFFLSLVATASPSSEEVKLNFSGSVKNGASYLHDINQSMSFELKPYHNGWEVIVHDKNRPKENLARLTPPLNGLNDLYVEILNGEVPQKTREFIFSPQVGETIQGSRSSDPVSEDEVERVRHDGHGVLEMTNLKLSKLNTVHPVIDEMNFDVKITYRPR